MSDYHHVQVDGSVLIHLTVDHGVTLCGIECHRALLISSYTRDGSDPATCRKCIDAAKDTSDAVDALVARSAFPMIETRTEVDEVRERRAVRVAMSPEMVEDLKILPVNYQRLEKHPLWKEYQRAVEDIRREIDENEE